MNPKSNWSVASCLQNLFWDFLRWNTYVQYMGIFSVTRFVLYFSETLYILSIFINKFSACICSSELSLILGFWKIYDSVILRPTSEACIWILIFTFGMFVFGEELIER